MLISIPPKVGGAQVAGSLTGKSAIPIARSDFRRQQHFRGQHFWARGDSVSTGGRDEAAIRKCIREQGVEDQGLDLLTMCER
jgi:putative transposase